MPTFTTQVIAAAVDGELAGPADLAIAGLQQIEQALPADLTFIGSEKYAKLWPASRASAALVARKIASFVEPRPGTCLILVGNADLAMARVLEMFTPPSPTGGFPTSGGIHPTAIIDPTAIIEEDIQIGAHCVIGPRVRIGAGCVIYPHVTILDDSAIGPDCILWPGVVIRERCTLGSRCILHPNVTIGADGFGYRPSTDGKTLVKVPQIGVVTIGDDVEIGANSCIDRGKFAATVIGDGCKFDNLVQIAHNCVLGRNVIIAGQAGVGGSTTIGDGAIIGGRSGISDHVNIAAGGVVMGGSAVMRDVEPGQRIAGVPARDSRQFFREQAALGKLPEMIKEARKKE